MCSPGSRRPTRQRWSPRCSGWTARSAAAVVFPAPGGAQEQGGGVVNSVGFAGPGQRYTLAIMNGLGGDGGYDDGVQTTTELSRILLGP